MALSARFYSSGRWTRMRLVMVIPDRLIGIWAEVYGVWGFRSGIPCAVQHQLSK